MQPQWLADYVKTNTNALTADWFVSPLEYSWGNGKALFEQMFPGPTTPNANYDDAAARALYRNSMTFDFRAKMMVYAFMREPIAKTYALEIESGLMSLFRLDFQSCLSQWIYVVEGYCRQLFQVTSLQNVKSTGWVHPATGDAALDGTIKALGDELAEYLDSILYTSSRDPLTNRLNRHLLLHGNLQNKAFFSQKNCLVLMFVLDALVFIEMVKNKHFPQLFDSEEGEDAKIARRKAVYAKEMDYALTPENALKMIVLSEHA